MSKGAAGLSRRGLFGAAGAAGAATVLGAAALAGDENASASPNRSQRVAFHGEHQAGIVTPAQDRLAFAAFDLTTTSRDELRDLLREWTAAAAAMTAGKPVPGRLPNVDSPPPDTGEAIGLAAAHLTVTCGFGPGMFVRDGADTFGLARRRPAALEPLPAFPHDALEPGRTGGDLCVQACADDPQVAFHAVRNLARIGRGAVAIRWFQLGFGRTSTTSRGQDTPRNLMGFKDGTNNIRAEDTAALAQHVWAGGDPAWMRGGSYLVARRIRMLIESWDRATLSDQEATFGRHRDSGAPLGGTHETDKVNLAARKAGAPVIPVDAHIRVAAPAENDGIRILRRGYSYTDGIDARTGKLDAGLFFIAYQADPGRGFIPLQRRLAANDALNEYIEHTGGGIFACPPGVRDGDDWWGRTLFA
ncbi:MAG: iron uptake transporter deferrochelatase/peroxidase subunit [Mycobacteriales bacterium]